MSCCTLVDSTGTDSIPIIHPKHKKIQIVVSRVERRKSKEEEQPRDDKLLLPLAIVKISTQQTMGQTGEETINTGSRNQNYTTTGKNKNKLPPLTLPGDAPGERETRRRLLSPGRPIFRTRSPSPIPPQTGSDKAINLQSSWAKKSPTTPNTNSIASFPASPNGPCSSAKLSRYHRGCIPPDSLPTINPQKNNGGSSSSNLSVCSSGPHLSRSSSSSPIRSPFAYLKVGPRPSSPSPGSVETPSGKPNPMDPERVMQFLKENPKFLEKYIKKNVDYDTLQQWVAERDKGAHTRRQSLAKWRFGSDSEKFVMFRSLATQLRRSQNESGVLWELSNCISSAVNANAFVLYLLDVGRNSMQKFSPQIEKQEFESFPLDDGTLASYVCRGREPIRITRTEALARFPNGVGDGNDSNHESYYILCHPIVKADGEIIGVIELHREKSETPFYKEDEEIVHSYLVWGGIALHYADLNSIMNKQKKLNEFLLGVVRSIFQDMISMDAVIKKVMNFAQRLVDADRASLFLVDSRTKELYARIFDMGSPNGVGSGNETVIDGTVKEIRFPMGTGIAGLVATSGGILNIPDAYQDSRFNRGVDQVTGYLTKSILCMPVFIRSTIIGVVQMVNKKHGTFTTEDEDAFEMFAVYCGLALHHAKLYDKIRRSEQKYRVALEVLSYHNSCSEEEFQAARSIGIPKNIPGLDDFYFKPNSIDALQKVHYSVFQFVELFGLSRFDIDSIFRFTLTVKKNYRAVPYHNWSHGFTVAHCMYCILKKSTAFRPLECLALYVGSLCHDLDHRGKSNKYMLETASPLASIYSTSTMEHHHFNQTVTILQQEGHNIFGKLSSEEYKQVLGNIKHCILATDLALFFTNKARLDGLMNKNTFNWGFPEHRLMAQAIAMTASDLCASAKPWLTQVETVKVIFEEFYNQGDLEKAAGRVPIPMMDRDRADELAASQVGFINGICIPCYEVLKKLVPETAPLLQGCQTNVERWRELDQEQNKTKKTQQKDQDLTKGKPGKASK